MKRILSMFVHNRKLMFCMIMSLLIVAPIGSYVGAINPILISKILAEPDRWKILVSMMVLFGIIRAVTTYISKYIKYYTSSSFQLNVEQKIESKIIDADIGFFEKYSPSNVISILDDAQDTKFIILSIIDILSSIIDFIVLMFVTFSLIRSYVVILLPMYLVIACYSRYMYKRFEANSKERNKFRLKMNQVAENTVNGYIEVRTFGQQENYRKQFHDNNIDFMKSKTEHFKLSTGLSAVLGIFEDVGDIIIIILMVYLSAKNGTDLLLAPAIIMNVSRLQFVVNDAVMNCGELFAMTSQMDKIADVLEYEDSRPVISGNQIMGSFNDSICLRSVFFRYPNSNTLVLQCLDLEINKGDHIGIHGTTGGGKSTLLKIIGRLYQLDWVNGGSIFIDGVNLDLLDRESYMRHVCYIQQNNILFPGTIEENIMIAKPEATQSELKDAIIHAGLYDFVKSLKDGCKTLVGPNGIRLSGGQKQRIAIARMFLRDPDIILLDESTSALDNETEAVIQEYIDAMKDKTIIIVAHRLSTLKNCNKIYELAQGRLIESTKVTPIGFVPAQ